MWDVIAVVSILFCIATAVVIVKLLAWRYRVVNLPENMEGSRRAYEERLHRPDWDFYERYLQRPVPKALKECYIDRELILGAGFEFDLDGRTCYILTFQAIDPQGLIEAMEYYHLDIVPFAQGEAEAYYLRPGSDEPNAVYSAFEESPYDGPEQDPEAEDVAVFLELLRKSADKQP